VFESGYSSTGIVPFYEGYAFTHLAKHIPLGGKHITDLLENEFKLSNVNISQENLQIVKESISVQEIVIDSGTTVFEDALSLSLSSSSSSSSLSLASKEYELPDGNKVTITTSMSQCVECMFNSNLMYHKMPALSEVYSSTFSSSLLEVIDSCSEEIREEILSNIILSGGNTLFKGFKERIKNDLITSIKNDVDTFGYSSKVQVISGNGKEEDRKNAAWLGAAALASVW
jgi:actin-related protein